MCVCVCVCACVRVCVIVYVHLCEGSVFTGSLLLVHCLPGTYFCTCLVSVLFLVEHIRAVFGHLVNPRPGFCFV